MSAVSHDRGSATVWVLMLASVLTLMGVGAVLISAGIVAHRRASAAADLAALAGATRSVLDETAACIAAASVAIANGARLTECELNATSLVVQVTVDPAGQWLPDMKVAARAGYRSVAICSDGSVLSDAALVSAA